MKGIYENFGESKGVKSISLYEFLSRITEILAPNYCKDLFFYIIHSMDNNGVFLRTRYCYREKILPNFNGDYNATTVLVTLAAPFDFDNDSNYYTDGFYTKLKMQIFLGDCSDDKMFYQKSEWSNAVGFNYILRIDMLKGTYEVLEFCYDKRQHYTMGNTKYRSGDNVSFRLYKGDECEIKDGIIQILYAYSDLVQKDEPSYDIEVSDSGEIYLCKHIKESDIISKNRTRKLKDYFEESNTMK